MVNWKLIEKEYKKLKVPKTLYQPNFNIFSDDEISTQILLSERGVGKTTNILLVGLLLNKYYGTVIQYIRTLTKEFTVSYARKLVNIINEFGYIEKITDNEYNYIIYDKREFFYCLKDEKGIIKNVSPNPVITVLIVENAGNYKSGYNAPHGDLIIYDEFIDIKRTYYTFDKFLLFNDLKSTIIRLRENVKIVMLANTLDNTDPFFQDLEIYSALRKMTVGVGSVITTKRGMKQYVEIISPDKEYKKKKDVLSIKYFGYDSEKLNSITGFDGKVWNVEENKRIKYKLEERLYTLFIEYSKYDYIRCDIGIVNNILVMYCYMSNKENIYEDSIILTLEENNIVPYNNYFYGLGNEKIKKLFKVTLNTSNCYFSTNEVGTMFYNYINDVIRKDNKV